MINEYTCPRCGHEWADEWDCACDDECPQCGMRHINPKDKPVDSAYSIKLTPIMTQIGFPVDPSEVLPSPNLDLFV